MAKTVVKIPNFISGVSQQIPALRFPAQMEAQENGLPSIKNGYGRRYGAEHVQKLPSTISTANNWHFIDRGDNINENVFSSDWDDAFGDVPETNRYAVAFADGAVVAHNLLGRSETINEVGNATGYLATSDPKLDLDFITIQDFTFILNKQVQTKMSTTQDSFRPFEALVFFAKSLSVTQYVITINGIDVSSQDVVGAATLSTNELATQAATDITTDSNMIALGIEAAASGSTVYILSTLGSEFTVEVTDGHGETSLKAFMGSTPKFNALPQVAVDGFRIKIDNDVDYDEDSFWVEYRGSDSSTSGHWVESRQDGSFNKIDATTMPHQLIHNTPDIWSTDFSGDFGIQTFSISPINWEERLVGDETTAPPPSFIESSISDIFFMRNRLGFCSDESIIQSEDSHSFNFWPSTMQTLLDTAPIDVGTSHSKSSTFRHAVPSQEKLLLFSSDTLFLYGSGDLGLSPKTVRIDPSSEVSINRKVRPFPSGSSVFFAIDKKKGTAIKEISTESSDDTIIPQDITSHVPDYLPKDLQLIAGSNIDNMLFFLSNDDLDTIYVYKFLDEGGKRILSSWHKWTFAGTDVEIAGMAAMDDTLYRICKYTETGSVTATYLEKIELTPDYLNTEFTHPLLLDRLVTVQGAYDSGTDLTTWTLPYDDSDTFTIVQGAGFTNAGVALAAASVTTPTATTIAFPGDQATSGVCHIGKIFEVSSTMTQPLLKNETDGKPVVERNAVYTVSNFTVDFFESNSFDIDVTYKDGTTRTYAYSAIADANTDFTIGSFNFNTDSKSVPIKTRRDRKVTVKVYNDDGYVPNNWYSARWIMNVTRSKTRF